MSPLDLASVIRKLENDLGSLNNRKLDLNEISSRIAELGNNFYVFYGYHYEEDFPVSIVRELESLDTQRVEFVELPEKVNPKENSEKNDELIQKYVRDNPECGIIDLHQGKITNVKNDDLSLTICWYNYDYGYLSWLQGRFHPREVQFYTSIEGETINFNRLEFFKEICKMNYAKEILLRLIEGISMVINTDKTQ